MTERPRPRKCVDCGVQTHWGKVEVSFEYEGLRLSIAGVDGMICPQCGREYVPGREALALSQAAEDIFRSQQELVSPGRVA